MYKLYIKEPDEIKGTRVGEYSLLEDVRADVKDLMDGRPEGTQAYSFRQSYDPETEKYWGSIRPAEAWQIEGGRLRTIWTRYRGGDWPATWRPDWWMEDPQVWTPLDPEYGYAKDEFEAGRLADIILSMPDWKESKSKFLELGPKTIRKPGDSRRSRIEFIDEVFDKLGLPRG